MANPYFVAGVLAPITYTMSATENSSFPLSNLKTYDPRDMWKGGGGMGDESLKINLGADDPVDTVVFHYHNFEVLQAIQSAYLELQYDNNNNGAYSAVTTVLTIDGQTGLSEPSIFTFSKITGKRYWRVLFTKAGGSYTPEIGNIFTRQRFDFGPKGLPSISYPEQYQTSIVNPTLDGTLRRSQSIGGRRTWEFDFSLLSDATTESFRKFFSRVQGASMPWYYVDEYSAGYFTLFDDDRIPAEQIAYNVNRTNRIRFREVLTENYTPTW